MPSPATTTPPTEPSARRSGATDTLKTSPPASPGPPGAPARHSTFRACLPVACTSRSVAASCWPPGPRTTSASLQPTRLASPPANAVPAAGVADITTRSGPASSDRKTGAPPDGGGSCPAMPLPASGGAGSPSSRRALPCGVSWPLRSPITRPHCHLHGSRRSLPPQACSNPPSHVLTVRHAPQLTGAPGPPGSASSTPAVDRDPGFGGSGRVADRPDERHAKNDHHRSGSAQDDAHSERRRCCG